MWGKQGYFTFLERYGGHLVSGSVPGAGRNIGCEKGELVYARRRHQYERSEAAGNGSWQRRGQKKQRKRDTAPDN